MSRLGAWASRRRSQHSLPSWRPMTLASYPAPRSESTVLSSRCDDCLLTRPAPSDRRTDRLMPQFARPITHVGLSVPDINAAVAWYHEVLGFRILVHPVEVDRTDEMSVDVFGA